jgi:iron-sulfur cluster repair protein YtfE (RIC family)
MERFDLLNSIHKALRHAMLTANLEAGRVDFGDADALARVTDMWTALRENLGHHAHHEDELIFPLLRNWAPEETDSLYDDHRHIHQIEAELDEVLRRVAAEPDVERRRRYGREFYRSLHPYTATCLRHFDDEERRLMPRLWALYDDAELAAVFGTIMATIGPEEREYAMDHMKVALDPQELAELQRRMGAPTG